MLTGGLLALGANDVGDWTGLGAGAVLIVLVFRTLWRFSTDSATLVDGYKDALDQARDDAAEALKRAAAAEAEVIACEHRGLTLEKNLRAERLELETRLNAELRELHAELAILRSQIVRDPDARTRETDPVHRPPSAPEENSTP